VKRCAHPRAAWAACACAWHCEFFRDGRKYRYSLDKLAKDRGLPSPRTKDAADAFVDALRAAVRSGTFAEPLIASHRQARAGRPSALYRLWTHIKTRCLNSKSDNFQYYGGRGLGMWSGWAALYECFEQDIIAEIGPHPGDGWSLDRIDNDKGYEPGNVRWATASMQNRNRRPWTVRKQGPDRPQRVTEERRT